MAGTLPHQPSARGMRGKRDKGKDGGEEERERNKKLTNVEVEVGDTREARRKNPRDAGESCVDAVIGECVDCSFQAK